MRALELLNTLRRADFENFEDEELEGMVLADAGSFGLIEYAIRSAIKARGWRWEVGTHGYQGGTLAMIHYGAPYSVQGKHSNPAVALGLAYLKTLEVSNAT